MKDICATEAAPPRVENGHPPTIEIRLAIDADLPHLVRLMAEMDDADVDPRDEGAAAMIRATMATMTRYPDFKIYVLLEAGLPVASFSLMIFCSPSHNGALQALLDAVVVQRDRRSAGLGAIMLEHAMHRAAAAGCYKLMLSSNIRRTNAHRFYEGFGFSQHGISFSIDVPAVQVTSTDAPTTASTLQ